MIIFSKVVEVVKDEHKTKICILEPDMIANITSYVFCEAGSCVQIFFCKTRKIIKITFAKKTAQEKLMFKSKLES